VDGVALLRTTEVPVAANSDDRRLGSLLCMRYQVRRVVADGGMGRVYEALDTHDKSRVAIKVLHADVARDPIAVERFKREFEVSKQLSHEHIVDVRDFAETEDKSYALVMEFLDGEELRMMLRREKRMAPERLIRMLSQTAIGLDRAHQQKLVHRDLKPDNLFLCGTREGDLIKILDFGSVRDNSSMAKKLTVAGTTIGSPYYMAPEQAQGLESLDARADVWALAAIAYECLIGTVPFQGINGPSILLAILTQDPAPPSAAAKGGHFAIPPALDDVMEMALAKNANIRTASVGQLADAIGKAYGLSGDHRSWADTPQATLAEGVRQGAMRVAAQAPTGVSPAGPVVAPYSAPATTSSMPPSDRPMGVPSGPPKWLVPAVVGVIAVLAGLIGAVLLLR
jgi:serine/threonine protein kinase